MSEIEEAKANILGGKQRVESARKYATTAGESYAGANGELLQAFKGLEKVLGHLRNADDRYRDEIKPRNAGALVELTDASTLFHRAEDEWHGDGLESPTYLANCQEDVFSDNANTLQDGYTALREILTAIADAKDRIQSDLLPQTDASIPSSPATLTKDFAEATAPQIEAIAKGWLDSL